MTTLLERVGTGDWPDPRTDEGWADWIDMFAGKDSEWQDIPEHRKRAVDSLTNAEFIATHWTANPSGPAGLGQLLEAVAGVTWRCDMYDPIHRLCGAHENRPPICRDAPFYGAETAVPLPTTRPPYPKADRDFVTGDALACSYQLDLPAELRTGGRPLIPLEVI